jgi:Lysylphosphatidylglycerol synthase TM region
MAAFLVLGAFLSAAAVAGVVWAAGPTSVATTFRAAEWRWLLLAPPGMVLSHLGYTVAYHQLSSSDGAPELDRTLAVALVASGFGSFNPGGGFAVDRNELRSLGLTRRQATRRVLSLGVIEFGVLAPVVMGAALYLLVVGSRARADILPSWAIGVPTGVAMAACLLVVRNKLHARGRWWGPLRLGLEALDRAGTTLKRRPAGPAAIAGMALYWTGDIVALAVCVAAFANRTPEVAGVIVGYATGYVLTPRSLPLSGAGPVDALLPFALSWVGVPLAVAILGVATYRALNLTFNLAAATAGRAHLRRFRPRRARPVVRRRPAA